METEYGEISYPYTPVLRVITPVQTPERRVGYLVINLDVWGLASRLNFSPDFDFRAEVVNQYGYYIASQNKSKLFGDSIPERKGFNLAQIAPKTWQALSSERMGYVFEDGNLFAFNTVDLAQQQRMHLIIQLNSAQLLERAERDLNDLAQEQLIVFFTVMVFAFPLAYLVTHYRRRNLESKLARAALNGMSAVMISDKQHRTIMTNNEFENMTGYSKSQVDGKMRCSCCLKTVSRLIPPKPYGLTLRSMTYGKGSQL